MAEEGSTVHYFGTEENIVLFSILVILVPFITGIFLMGVRGLEIKRGKNYSEKFSSIVGVGGLATSWVFSIIVAIDYFRNYIRKGR